MNRSHPSLAIEANRWWLFWAVFVALAGILTYQLVGFSGLGKGFRDGNSNGARNGVGIVVDGKRNTNGNSQESINGGSKSASVMTDEFALAKNIDPKRIIDYSKKAVCNQHAHLINTQVEIWYIYHDGEYPRDNLSDIGRDKNYFPKGLPTCPYDNKPYRLDPNTHRVVGYTFVNEKLPEDLEQLLDAESSEK